MARSPQNDRLIYRNSDCPMDTRIDPRDLLAIPSIGTYIITDAAEFRPALVSYLLYRTPDFWWILMDYNQVTYTDIKTGLVLRVPQESAVRTLLERARRNRILADGANAATLANGTPTRMIVSV